MVFWLIKLKLPPSPDFPASPEGYPPPACGSPFRCGSPEPSSYWIGVRGGHPGGQASQRRDSPAPPVFAEGRGGHRGEREVGPLSMGVGGPEFSPRSQGVIGVEPALASEAEGTGYRRTDIVKENGCVTNSGVGGRGLSGRTWVGARWFAVRRADPLRDKDTPHPTETPPHSIIHPAPPRTDPSPLAPSYPVSIHSP